MSGIHFSWLVTRKAGSKRSESPQLDCSLDSAIGLPNSFLHPRIDDRVSVLGETELRQFLAVVFRYDVRRRAWNVGPSATQTLRFPSSFSVHAMRFTFFAADRFAANGALRTCSRVKGFCAGAIAASTPRPTPTRFVSSLRFSPTCSIN